MINDLLNVTDLRDIPTTPLVGRYIYFILNKENAVIYVGQTFSPAYRLDCHRLNPDFHSVKMIEVSDKIPLIDAEFMEINHHKPLHNKTIPCPTFLITTSRIKSDGVEHLYNLDEPDCTINVNKKSKPFWLRKEFSGIPHFHTLVYYINESNKQNELINRLVDGIPPLHKNHKCVISKEAKDIFNELDRKCINVVKVNGDLTKACIDLRSKHSDIKLPKDKS